MKTYWIITYLVLTIFSNQSFSQEYIRLWPEGKMPNSKGMKLERIEERERVTQIDLPGMYAFFTSKEENKGSAVLIFPPGGYRKLTYNIAGLQLAKWFNTFGVNAFVVMYRLPNSPDLKEPAFGPIMDGQRAMKLVRANAVKWGINPDKIGVMGCSAGGGISANMSTITTDYATIGDSLDAQSVLPNFQILVSGAISVILNKDKGSSPLLGEGASEEHEKLFSAELNVSAQTPPAFITCAANDPVLTPLNSLRYFEALQNAGVSSCLHIFSQGGHSIALRNNPYSTNLWPNLCEAWLDEIGMLKNNSQK